MPLCDHCAHETPEDSFCAWCGAHQSPEARSPAWRLHHYAAHPGEHVAQPSVITTLLPHLPGHRIHEFRWGLIGGVAVVAGLVGAGLIVAALLTAAVLVPVLYLVYLYEAQVYRDEPARVVGLTLVSGAVLGVATATVANAVVPSSSPLNPTASGVLLISAVLLPIVQEIVKPVPALFLRPLAKFNQTIDGLVFGVATGLGFAAAETIVDFSRVITYEPLRTSSADWLFPMLSIAVLTPLMQASCTGAIMASLWRHSPKGASSALYAIGIPVAILAHVGFSLGSQLITRQGANQPSVLAWQAAVVAGLLVYIRFLVHRALLDEAGSLGLHLSVCPYCRRRVETAGFCSSCGSASSAGPRTSGSPRLASETPRPDPAGRAAD